MLWRGATEWPVFEDGRTMVIAGGNAAKFVVYPIHVDPAKPAMRLTNWGVMARVAQAGEPLPHREDWSRAGDVEAAMQFVRDRFRLDWVDPVALIEATRGFYEYPNCDRDPLPRWSFGRVTLLGDAAHPMSPVGSNGASQAILDARVLARHLSSGTHVVDALAAYRRGAATSNERNRAEQSPGRSRARDRRGRGARTKWLRRYRRRRDTRGAPGHRTRLCTAGGLHGGTSEPRLTRHLRSPPTLVPCQAAPRDRRHHWTGRAYPIAADGLRARFDSNLGGMPHR